MAPAAGAAHVAGDRGELVEGHPVRLERAEVLRQPILHPLRLTLEGPKQPVPDDQDATVVAVEVELIGAVVDAVVRGRVEDELDRRSRPIRSVWIQNW
jgi:hypothetical protein